MASTAVGHRGDRIGAPSSRAAPAHVVGHERVPLHEAPPAPRTATDSPVKPQPLPRASARRVAAHRGCSGDRCSPWLGHTSRIG